MKKLRRFKCGSCHREYERFVDDDIQSIKCECKSMTARTLATPRDISKTTGKSHMSVDTCFSSITSTFSL